MPRLAFECCRMGRSILALYADDGLYVGSGAALIDFGTGETLCRHTKSIRCIAGDSKTVGCCSYDGTATVLARGTHKFVERIEGPETEMKGMAIEDSYVVITTRGRTVWILENLEISKILDDHLHDVKGCRFYEKRLYSWSYDNTVKMYELFQLDHSWELAQSIDLGCIVWNVVFLDGKMYAMLHDGRTVRLAMHSAQWHVEKDVQLSVYPLLSSCVAGAHMAVVCNRDCLVLLDGEFNIVAEALLSEGCPGLGRRYDILSCCYWERKNAVVCGGEDGMLYTVGLQSLEPSPRV